MRIHRKQEAENAKNRKEFSHLTPSFEELDNAFLQSEKSNSFA